MSKKTLILVGLLVCLCAVAVRAQMASERSNRGPTHDLILDGNKDKATEGYWLGLWCSPVPAALRAHVDLPEKQGLLVQNVAVESPAAKGGVNQYDIILRVNEKPLLDPRELATAVETAKETPLKMELMRAGKTRTAEVTPAKRPKNAGMPSPGVFASGDREALEKWLQGVWSSPDGVGGTLPPMRFRVLHPGAIVSRGQIPMTSLPANTNVTISKEADKPIRIVVKQGEKTWAVTEKELDKLPADVRSYVERMLGQGSLGVVGESRTFDLVPDVSNGKGRSPSQDPQQLEKRISEMNLRMEKMMRAMEAMMGERAQHGTTAKPEK